MAGIAQELAQNFSGPVIFHYVWWVLWEAKKRGLKQLYFLARDGYTLHKIAELFCKKFDLGIRCSYLYCSRAALRMPSYFFIGDEALELLFLRGYRVTLKSLLQRGELTDEERLAVYNECGMNDIDENRIISRAELDQYASRIKKSRTFRACIVKRSRSAYMDAIGYFKTEGMMEQPVIAIVDSGWTGSMQRSLRQILEFSGYSGAFLGFYFGMYASPKAQVDGEYLTWFFRAGVKAKEKAVFCNNLFECLLSAPHGMTISYRKTNDGYGPVQLPAPVGAELALISEQSDLICRYADAQLKYIAFYEFNGAEKLQDTASRIKRYMFNPTQEEAVYYGQFLFCDDITDAYRMALADEKQKDLLKNYSLLHRFFRKMTRLQPKSGTQEELFWPYGTAAFLPQRKKWWYQLNFYIWEWLRHRLSNVNAKHSVTKIDPAAYRREIERYDVISFDIFDTLLYRVVNKPVDVFGLMEPFADEIFGIQDFKEKRIAAEEKARRLTENEEITLAEIYKALGVGNETAKVLMRHECETELSVLRRDNIMADLLLHCIESGKRVLIISDMYQDKTFVQEALKQAGICGYHALYVSSERKATKASGSLFCQVVRMEKITNRKQWLHIGNDFHSDYAIPKAMGLSALLYNNRRMIQNAHNSVLRRMVGIIKTRIKLLT